MPGPTRALFVYFRIVLQIRAYIEGESWRRVRFRGEGAERGASREFDGLERARRALFYGVSFSPAVAAEEAVKICNANGETLLLQ